MNHNGRKQYTVMDVLQQARGLPTDGWGVLTKDFIDDLCRELERLYQIEDELPLAIEQLKTAVNGLAPPLVVRADGTASANAAAPIVISSGYVDMAAKALRNLSDLCGIGGTSAPV